MPTKSKNAPTPEAREKLLVIADWIEAATSEVEDIRGWRDAEPSDRLHQFWTPLRAQNRGVHQSTMPGRLFSWTVSLRAWIRELSPKDDTECIQDVYQAVFAWHDDHNAERLPPQNELDSALERAVSLLLVLRAQLERERGGATPPAAVGDSGSEGAIAASITRIGAAWKIVFGQEECVLLDQLPARVLRALVSRQFQQKPITAFDLLERPAPDVRSNEHVADAAEDDEYLRQVRSQARELKEAIVEARAADDADEVARLTCDLQRLLEHVSAPEPTHPPRRKASKSERSAINSVVRAIEQLKLALRSCDPPMNALADHLDASVQRTSNCWVYRPAAPAPQWEI